MTAIFVILRVDGAHQPHNRGVSNMKNPLESLPSTIIMGLILTVILVIVVQAIGT